MTVSEEEVTRPLVRPGKFFRLPLASEDKGVLGYFKSPLHPTYRGALGGRVFDTTDELQPVEPSNYQLFRSDVPNFVRRPNEQLVPRESWEAEPPVVNEAGESDTGDPPSSNGQPTRRQTTHSILSVNRIELPP